MKTNHLLMRPLIYVALCVLLSSGCQTTPPSVKQLSSQSRQESRLLGQVHEQTIQAFSDFTQEVEDKGRPLVAFAYDRHQRLGQAGYLLLVERANIAEARLLARFDTEAQKWMESALESALQTNFFDVVQLKKVPLLKEKEKFGIEHKNAPADIQALKRLNDKDLQILYVERLAFQEELKLRMQALSDLRKSKQEFHARIRAMLDPFRADYMAKAGGVSLSTLVALPDLTSAGVSTNLSLKGVRSELATFRTKVADAYTSHQETLEGLRDYLERPGVAQLLIAGMFQAVGDLLKSKLPALGSWGEAIGGVAQPLLTKAEDALNEKVAEGEALVTKVGEKFLDSLAKSAKQSGATVEPSVK